jgi:hypothetical protein
MYELVITRIEPNPNYDAEFAEKVSRNRNFGYNGVTEAEVEKTRVVNQTIALQVELTDEEYRKFKRAALEIDI